MGVSSKTAAKLAKRQSSRPKKTKAQVEHGKQLNAELEQTLKTLEGVASTSYTGKERRRNLIARLKSKGLRVKEPVVPSPKLRRLIAKSKAERERKAKEAGEAGNETNAGRKVGNDFLVTSQRQTKTGSKPVRRRTDSGIKKVKDYGKMK